MKVLQLNVWMGRIPGSLLRFLRENKFDIICMQEVMYSEDRAVHLSRFCATRSMIKEASGLEYEYYSPNWGTEIAGGGTAQLGNLILTRLPMLDVETIFTNKQYVNDLILEGEPSNIANLQVVKLDNGLTVANHHGYWDRDPMGNEYSVERMGIVAERLKMVSGPLVFCGDLNLVHDAPAMRHLDFLRDLVVENNVRTTLSRLGFDDDVTCDHILVNDLVGVEGLFVYQDVVSDHLGVSVEV